MYTIFYMCVARIKIIYFFKKLVEKMYDLSDQDAKILKPLDYYSD